MFPRCPLFRGSVYSPAAMHYKSLSLCFLSRCRALHDTRSKLLADVFYGSPGSASLVENVHHENLQLEELEGKTG